MKVIRGVTSLAAVFVVIAMGPGVLMAESADVAADGPQGAELRELMQELRFRSDRNGLV